MQVNIIYKSQLFSFLQNTELFCHSLTKKKICETVIEIEKNLHIFSAFNIKSIPM